MKKLNKIILLSAILSLSTIFTSKVLAKIYPEYKIGDKITYKDMDFYVIENSDKTKDSVTMLKAEPLTVDEVNKYGVGHINKNTHVSVGTAYDSNGYGGMAYYTSSTCGYVNNSLVIDSCTTDYATSEVKYAVDSWATDKFNVSDLTEDSLGYKARLLTFEELTANLGYTRENGTIYMNFNPENTPFWVYNSNCWYWTMSQYDNSASNVWYVGPYGNVSFSNVYSDFGGAVRPVITLAKTPIDVYYNIDTKTDNNGTIKVDKKEALEDEKVTISITANEGYKLKNLKVYKTSDNEDVTSLVDYNSETNEFVMPDYDVTVSAEFEKIIENNEVIDNQNKIENPKTIDKISIYVIVSILGVGALVIFMLCKRKWNIK